MSTTVACPQGTAQTSDWPASLLLDELWLRTRRVLVRRLETEGLWPASDEIRAHRTHRAELGRRLRAELLPRLLSPAEYRYLESDAAFGPCADVLNAKIGRCLAFGYELGSVLHRAVAGPSTDRPGASAAADLCAVFNLGIGIFDLVHDESAELAEQFGRLLDAAVLSQAVASSEAAARLDPGCDTLASPELRLLGRLVAAFITGLHRQASSAAELEPIGRVLAAAYAAEKASAAGMECPDPFAVSRAKSTLPFHVLLQTAALVGHGTPAAATALGTAADAMGTVFWLVDDLVDLVVDVQSGALNSVLARAGAAVGRHPDAVAGEYALLEAVLAGHSIDDTVQDVVDAMRVLGEELRDRCPDPEAAAAVCSSVRDHVRFWVE